MTSINTDKYENIISFWYNESFLDKMEKDCFWRCWSWNTEFGDILMGQTTLTTKYWLMDWVRKVLYPLAFLIINKYLKT